LDRPLEYDENVRKILPAILLTFVLLFQKATTAAVAGTFSLSPATGNQTLNSTFNVDVKFDTGSDTVKTIKVYLTFPANLLSVDDVLTVGSSVITWAERLYSNTNGTVSLSGDVDASGITGSGKLLATIKFKAKANGTETCNLRVGLTLYQTKACDAGTTGTPTPTETVPTPTDNPNCKCNALKNCTTQCQFDKFSDVTTYSNTIKCGLADSGFQTVPTADNKNSWCRVEKRTKGDADGDGSVTFKDYFYYVTAKLGFKIPPTINPDFNGDNVVDTKDREIIIKSLLGN